MIEKEFTADELLALIFLSIGLNRPITNSDIDNFVNIAYECFDQNEKHFYKSIIFNMPTIGNYSRTLFKPYRFDDDLEGFYIIDYNSIKQHLKIDKLFVECVKKGNITIGDYMKISDKFKKKFHEKKIIPKQKPTNIVNISIKVKKKELFLKK